MSIEVETITAPSYWACALIYGDESGMSDDEGDAAAYAEFCAYLERENLIVAGVAEDEDGEPQEPRFTWSYDLHWGDCAGGEVVDYIAHRIA